jgi:hypothetical protein
MLSAEDWVISLPWKLICPRRDPGDRRQGCTFAGPVGADQRDDLAGAQVKSGAFQGVNGAIINIEILNF